MESAELMWIVRKLADLEANHRALAKKHAAVRPYRAAETVASEWQNEADVPASVKVVLEAIAK